MIVYPTHVCSAKRLPASSVYLPVVIANGPVAGQRKVKNLLACPGSTFVIAGQANEQYVTYRHG